MVEFKRKHYNISCGSNKVFIWKNVRLKNKKNTWICYDMMICRGNIGVREELLIFYRVLVTNHLDLEKK